MKKFIMILFAVSFCIFNVSYASSVEALTNKLIDLRSQVEELSQKVESRKNDLSTEYKALSSRRNQLEAEIEAAEIKQKLGQERLSTIKKQLLNETVDNELIAPALDSVFENLASYIEKSLPYQTSKRIGELNKIKEDFNGKIMTAPKTIGRLWAFVEDELRLTRENGVHKFVINVSGEEKLATVAKLGMMNMYFQSGEFEYGMAIRKNGEYVFETVADKNSKKEIIALLDGLKKQIRVGRYDIPNTIVKEEIEIGNKI